MAAGDLGNTLLPPLAGVLAVTVAWKLGFGLAIPLFLVATAGIWIAVPGDERSPESKSAGPIELTGTLRRISGALWDRSIAIVTVIQTLGYCIWQGFTGFYPTYLVEVKGIAPPTATVLFGGFFALGIFIKPIAGSAYDLYGLRRSLPLMLVSITASMLLVPLADGLVSLVAITALASSVLGYGTMTLTYLTDSLPDDVRGTGLGFLRTGYMLIGAGSPTLIGVLADAGYFDQAFFLLASVGGIAALLSLSVPDR